MQETITRYQRQSKLTVKNTLELNSGLNKRLKDQVEYLQNQLEEKQKMIDRGPDAASIATKSLVEARLRGQVAELTSQLE